MNVCHAWRVPVSGSAAPHRRVILRRHAQHAGGTAQRATCRLRQNPVLEASEGLPIENIVDCQTDFMSIHSRISVMANTLSVESV